MKIDNNKLQEKIGKISALETNSYETCKSSHKQKEKEIGNADDMDLETLIQRQVAGAIPGAAAC